MVENVLSKEEIRESESELENSSENSGKIEFVGGKRNFEPKVKNYNFSQYNEDKYFLEKVKTVPPLKTFEWTFKKVIKSNFKGNFEGRFQINLNETFKNKILFHLKYPKNQNFQKNFLGKRDFSMCIGKENKKTKIKRKKEGKIYSNLQIQKLFSGIYPNFENSKIKSQTTNNPQIKTKSDISLAETFPWESEYTKSGKNIHFCDAEFIRNWLKFRKELIIRIRLGKSGQKIEGIGCVAGFFEIGRNAL